MDGEREMEGERIREKEEAGPREPQQSMCSYEHHFILHSPPQPPPPHQILHTARVTSRAEFRQPLPDRPLCPRVARPGRSTLRAPSSLCRDRLCSSLHARGLCVHPNSAGGGNQEIRYHKFSVYNFSLPPYLWCTHYRADASKLNAGQNGLHRPED